MSGPPNFKRNTVNKKWSTTKKIVAKIFILHLANFDHFLDKNDYSLVTFNDSISHLQFTIRKSHI